MFSPVKIFLALVLVVACRARLDPSNPKVQECLKENGLDADVLPHGPGEKPKPGLHCVMKCVFEKEGEIKSDGTLDLDKIEARMKQMTDRIPAAKIPEIMECAKKIDKIATCDDISKMMACHHLIKQDP